MLKRLSGKWLVAVSGQSDSMALLSMCIELNMDIMVCIVNHHKRSQADLEVTYVKRFCDEHQILCFVVDAPEFKANFQDSARRFRYQTFAAIVQSHGACGVLVAHHQDDVIETFCWQKARNHRVDHYGIKQTSYVEGVLVKRPLLHMTKEQIKKYNQDHGVYYFEDASNVDLSYSRNKIREQLKSMSEKEKTNLLNECYQKQEETKKIRSELIQYVTDSLNIETLINLNEHHQSELLWMYFSMQEYPFSISKKQIKDIIFKLSMNDVGMIPLKDEFYLYHQSNQLKLISKKNCHYKFTFDTIKSVKTSFFTIITESDNSSGVHIKEEDLPITIRNFENGDRMKVKIGHKKLTTWFNQEKIPWHLRQCWPVVLNKNNEIIYVVGWGCDINHSTNNPNLFMLK